MNVRDDENDNTDPEHALPQIIGIGGVPPQRIYLRDKVQKLAEQGEVLAGDEAWRRAIARVQARFDTAGWKLRSPQTPRCNYDWYSGGAAEEKQLDDRVAAVAAGIAAGKLPENVEEWRIANAIAAAHMRESGELARLQNLAIERYQQNLAIEQSNLARDPDWKHTLPAALEKAGWTPGMDGKDGSKKDGKIGFAEVQAALLEYDLTLIDVKEIDGRKPGITACDIAATLNEAAARDR